MSARPALTPVSCSCGAHRWRLSALPVPRDGTSVYLREFCLACGLPGPDHPVWQEPEKRKFVLRGSIVKEAV